MSDPGALLVLRSVLSDSKDEPVVRRKFPPVIRVIAARASAVVELRPLFRQHERLFLGGHRAVVVDEPDPGDPPIEGGTTFPESNLRPRVRSG
jgi:hypothetical protein